MFTQCGEQKGGPNMLKIIEEICSMGPPRRFVPQTRDLCATPLRASSFLSSLTHLVLKRKPPLAEMRRVHLQKDPKMKKRKVSNVYIKQPSPPAWMDKALNVHRHSRGGPPSPIPRRNASGENSVIQSVSHGQQQRIHISKVAKFSPLASSNSRAKSWNKNKDSRARGGAKVVQPFP